MGSDANARVRPDARAERYARALSDAGADAFVLTSEPAVRHASGAHLYTQRLIPQRPVACVVGADASLTVVCCVLEEDQLATDRPGLPLRPFKEYGDDPWRHVADRLAELGAEKILVEDTMPAAWFEGLADRHSGSVAHSFDAAVAPRIIKDPDERSVIVEGSLAAERAIAAGISVLEPGRTELEIAQRMVANFESELAGRTSEVMAMSIGPQHNRSMHHLATTERFPQSGPVRLGMVARVDGYWILITRMTLLGEAPGFSAAYERYVDVYEATLQQLNDGSSVADVYRYCDDAARAQRLSLTTLKIGHGTGLDFREPPIVGADAGTLRAGQILAYDYVLEADDGTVLHLEDRVAIDPDEPRRLSAAWDLHDLRAGHLKAT